MGYTLKDRIVREVLTSVVSPKKCSPLTIKEIKQDLEQKRPQPGHEKISLKITREVISFLLERKLVVERVRTVSVFSFLSRKEKVYQPTAAGFQFHRHHR